ncbi:hypothetical protein [Campylobacter ureolyticus]|uniref:Uncharacterized protein n=1 Tax=Campylobacter ureolyticus TaxID=827 RepID=A0A9Q4KQA2_9BACT|nr:hypothetical protein [Campylobacter ureolyticus]MCZ6134814.1 hypothetical protein [Campylobacter ureolyticus]MCZ6161555.1 hypothetical protein [Campylobacter ureolyticus]MCZ6170161.1 hypothetical protein [Campylobacter ureolyticus]QIX86652.1 hypothetical protein FOB81_04945 [Campylobacter ureolyticus]STA71051.1 phage integrase [Campylobacter ureolyticus]
MQKLSIADAASKLGVSKEAIYNRIRRNTIKSFEEDGVKYVILDEKQTPLREKVQKNSDFIEYLKSEIEYLKLKNRALQEDKEKLFREKEELLISTKDEIKSIYKERDEKLKYFLTLLEKPFLAKEPIDVEVSTEAIELKKEIIKESLAQTKTKDELKVEDKNKEEKKETWVSLREFLDAQNMKKKERKELKKYLVDNAYENKNIKIEAGMLYINSNFDINSIQR